MAKPKPTPVAQPLQVRRASPNPSGLSRPDLAAARTVGEVLRTLHTPEEFGRAMWSILSGVDPFAAERAKPNPDGVPAFGATEVIDWQHRMAAGKMYAEYAWGKPLQGVVVDAQIHQTSVNLQVPVGPVDPRSLPPEIRDMLRQVARAALGQTSDEPAAAPRMLDVHVNTEHVTSEPSDQAAAGGEDNRVNLDDIARFDVDGQTIPLEGAPARGLELGVEAVVDGGAVGQHVVNVPSDQPDVKGIYLDFRGSTNLVDATLGEDKILTVRFRASDGGVARSYRYRNVTPEMMERWRAAPSAGAWFAREIRTRHQQYPLLDAAVGRGAVVI